MTTISSASDVSSAMEALPQPRWATKRDVRPDAHGTYDIVDTSELFEFGEFEGRIETYSRFNDVAGEGTVGAVEVNIEWSDRAYENSHEQIILPIDRVPHLVRLLATLIAKAA